MSDDLRKPFKIEYTGSRVPRLTGKEALVGKIEFDGVWAQFDDTALPEAFGQHFVPVGDFKVLAYREE